MRAHCGSSDTKSAYKLVESIYVEDPRLPAGGLTVAAAGWFFYISDVLCSEEVSQLGVLHRGTATLLMPLLIRTVYEFLCREVEQE